MIKLKFGGTEQVFAAPTGHSLEQALAWIGRLNHPTICRTTCTGDAVYILHNNRRGVNRRSCVVEVVS